MEYFCPLLLNINGGFDVIDNDDDDEEYNNISNKGKTCKIRLPLNTHYVVDRSVAPTKTVDWHLDVCGLKIIL